MHSGFTLAKADPRPIYLQIIEQVQQRIALGDWDAGQPLPSIRELAAELRVSVITVKRAYLELELAGVITTRHGKGSEVADSRQLAKRLREAQLTQALDALARVVVQLDLPTDTLHKRLAEAVRRAKEQT